MGAARQTAANLTGHTFIKVGACNEGRFNLAGIRQVSRIPFEFCRQFPRAFVRLRGLRPDSAKTYGNLVNRTAWRKTDEFGLLGHLSVV